MRILVALKDAADRGEITHSMVEKVADRLWKGLWIEDRNTSEEAVMADLLDPILPGGWEKWKYVPPLPRKSNKYRRFRMEMLKSDLRS
jgi:hypothetical protein